MTPAPPRLARALEISPTVAVLVHAATVAFVALLNFLTRDPAITLLTGGALVAATFIWLFLVEIRRTALALNPLSFYLAWYAVGQGLSAVYYGARLRHEDSVSFSLAIVPAADLATGYLLFLCGGVALHMGLLLTRPAPAMQREVETREVRGALWISALIGMWFLGLWSLSSPAWVLRLGLPGRVLQWVPLAMLSAFLLAPRHWGLSRPAFLGIGATATLILAIVSFGSGSKAIVMLSLLPLGWALLASPRTRLWAPAAGVVVMLVYFAAVAPVITISRAHTPEPGEEPTAYWWRIVTGYVQGALRSTDPDGYPALERFLSRQFDAVPVGYLVGEVADSGHRLGGTMTYVPAGLIPRALWPDKPTVTQGVWFTEYIGFPAHAGQPTLSLGITATGELYWNFGFVGILIGMLTIGALLGMLWRLAVEAGIFANVASMTLYVIVMVNMPNMAEAGSTLIGILGHGIILGGAIAAWSAFRRAYPSAHHVQPEGTS